MADLKVFQIGVGSFGRYGFEKLVEMHNHLEEVDLELAGVCDTDPASVEAARKFAAANGIESIETFQKPRKMYDAASKSEDRVLIYDAGPAETHASHVEESLQREFFHLTEKPPSLRREGHMRERKLSDRRDVFYKVDFIERQSPVVRKTEQLLEEEEIESVEVFRESSIGIQKMLNPYERQGVRGGDVLDKMMHEVYINDLLSPEKIELESAESEYLMPKRPGSEKFMAVDGGTSRRIDGRTATAMTSAEILFGETPVRLQSSWIGLSERCREAAGMVEERTGEQPLVKHHTRSSGKIFRDEEARFFIIEGSRRLAGDMLHSKLYDLETGDKIEVPDLIHDQLYRVIENAVMEAVGRQGFERPGVDHDFVETMFDVRDEVLEGDEVEQLEKANRRIKQLTFEPGKEEVEA